jgi:hypothetical protein
LLIATIFTISIPVMANNPPGVEIIEPGAGETVSGVITIWIVAWDADGNDQIEDVWVKIDSGDYLNATYNHTDGEGQWWYFEWDTTAVEDGWHHITAMAFDGIDETTHMIEVFVDNVPDNNPPGVAIVHPDDGATVSGTIIIWIVAWDDDGNDQIEDVWIKIDSGDFLNATYNHTDGEGQWWYYEWDTTTVEDGWHSITAKTFDGMDDATTLIEVFVDNIPDNNPPQVEIMEPANGETVSGVIEIWIRAWDADGVDDVEMVYVKIDEGAWHEATFVEYEGEYSWWVFEWDTTTVDDGEHHIYAKAWDGTDHSEEDVIYVIVDNSPDNNPPGIEIVEPAGGETLSGTVIIWMVAWDADGNDQIQDVWVRIDGGDLQNATYNHTDGEGQWWYFEWDTTTVEDGWHHITAITFDGIDDASDVIEVLVDNNPDNNPPEIAIVEPDHGATVSGTVIIWMVAWDADGLDQIQDVWVRIDGGDLQNATYNHTNGEGQWWYFEWDTTTVDDGWHDITAVVFDGIDDGHDVIEVFVDNVPENNPPGIEIVEPAGGETVSGIVVIWMVAWDADGNDQIEGVWVRIDGGALLNATYNHTNGEGQWWYYEWDTTTVDDGWHHIKAITFDGIDDASDVIEVFVDNNPENHPPHVEIMEPANGETVSGVIEIWIRAWDEDGLDDIEMVYVKIDEGGWHEATFVEYEGDYSWWVFEWDTTTVDDGEHHIFAKAWDGVDHSDEDVIYVIVENEPENSPPGIEIVDPDDGASVSGTISILMVAWDPDGNDEIEMVWVKIDDGSWHEATFVEIDGEGSWWVYEWNTETVEDGWHHIYAKTTDGSLWADDHIEVYVNNGGENHPPYIEIMDPDGGDTVFGVITIWMVAWDADGLDDIEMVWVKIDDGPLNEATFHEIDGTGSWWFYEWDTTEVEDGWHTITAIVFDGIDDGHDVIEVLVENNPENSPPQVEIMEPANGETVSGVIEIWIRAWDPDGVDDVEMVFVKIDEGGWHEATFVEYEGDYSWWIFEWDTTTVDDGWHHIYAKSWDGELYSDEDVKEVYVDNTPENHPPHVEIVEPANGETVSGVVEIWLKAWDEDGLDDIEAVYVKIDDGGWHEATFVEIDGDFSWWVFEWDTTTVDDGEHHIYAKAWDGHEHSEEDVIYVIVDNNPENNPPGIEITDPDGGSTVSGVITIWMVAWDPDGNDQIENVWVRIDGGDLLNATYDHTDSEGQWWYYEWDTTEVEDGWHHIKAITFDGIDDASHLIEVFVDNVPDNHPPGIEIIEPEHGDTVSGTVIIWMVAWDEDGLDQIQDVWVRIDEGDLQNATYNHTDGEGQWWFFEWDTTEVDEGWHSITAVVFDGEDDGHHTIEVLVDNVELSFNPVVEIVAPSQDDKIEGQSEITLHAWDRDGVEDVETVFVRIDEGYWYEATFIEYKEDYSLWVFEWDTESVEDGEHQIHAKA